MVKQRYIHITALLFMIICMIGLSTHSIAGLLRKDNCAKSYSCCSSGNNSGYKAGYFTFTEKDGGCCESRKDLIDPLFAAGHQLYSDWLYSDCMNSYYPFSDLNVTAINWNIRDKSNSRNWNENIADPGTYYRTGEHAKIKLTPFVFFASQIHSNRKLFISVNSLLI